MFECDKSHSHATFAVTKQSGKWHFSTSDEAAYPTILCNRVARIIVDKLLSLGYSDRPAEWKPDEPAPQNSKEIKRATTGKFVRGNRLVPLLSEYSEIVMTELSIPEVRQHV